MNEVKLDERMERLEMMMQQLIDMVGKNNERLTAIEGRLDSMESRLGSVETRLDSMESRLEGIESEQRAMGVKVSRIDDAFDQTNFDTLALNKRVFRTESEIERLAQQ